MNFEQILDAGASPDVADILSNAGEAQTAAESLPAEYKAAVYAGVAGGACALAAAGYVIGRYAIPGQNPAGIPHDTLQQETDSYED